MSPEKRDRLAAVLRDIGPAVCAVSGGIDSRTLFAFARSLGLDVTAIHMRGPHVGNRETMTAERWLENLSAPYRVVEADPLVLPEVAGNDPLRCYHCKRLLFTVVLDHAAGRPVVEGSHADDMRAYRPGMKALAELGVKSPFAAAGFTKADIRALARELSLLDPDQPSRPCLLTRYAYGLSADASGLRRLARAEDTLAELGFVDFRLRLCKACEQGGRARRLLQLAENERERFVRREGEVLSALAGLDMEPDEIRFSETVSGFHDRETS